MKPTQSLIAAGLLLNAATLYAADDLGLALAADNDAWDAKGHPMPIRMFPRIVPNGQCTG